MWEEKVEGKFWEKKVKENLEIKIEEKTWEKKL